MLGVPAVPCGRMHLATLGDSQDKVGCTLLCGISGHLDIPQHPRAWHWCHCCVNAVSLQIDAINDRFTEAREEISIAHDDAETT